jgi:hypothetical protein
MFRARDLRRTATSRVRPTGSITLRDQIAVLIAQPYASSDFPFS